MDPFSSLSLATSVIQFLDFSAKILKVLKRSHSTARATSINRNEEIDSLISEFEQFQSYLSTKGSLRQVGSRDDQLGQSLEQITTECQNLSNELLDFLNSTRARQSKLSYLRATIKAPVHEEEVERLTQKLSVLRSNLDVILAGLRERIEGVVIQQSERFLELDDSTQNIVRALSDEQPTRPEELRDRAVAIDRLVDRNEHGDVSERRQLARRPTAHTRIGPPTAPPETEENIRIKVQTTLLDFLGFSVLNNRLESIAETHGRTYEWIFDEDPPVERWDSFPKWLTHGSGIYWVEGREASGKSTLMKHIYNSSKTRKLVEEWATPASPITAAFFFWNSGTILEKSQQGLLRSLIYTVLSQQQSLIPIVLSHAWAVAYSMITSQLPIQETDAGDLRNELHNRGFLLRAFKTLISQDKVPLKLFLLVDGLDEYDGDQKEIAELFRDICSTQNVKAIVSSRPLLVFSNTFESYPTLRLEKLNHNDIKAYVHDKLESNPLFRKLTDKNPTGSADLVEGIVTKSNGLFLWVVLVVHSLLDGLTNGDGLEDLQLRLLSLPAELGNMYDHILQAIPEIYQESTSRILQIVLAARTIQTSLMYKSNEAEPLTLIDLALADGDPNETIEAGIEPWTERAILHKCRAMKLRLQSRCSGLLELRATNRQDVSEIDPASMIQYSHRSVREYLQGVEIHGRLLMKTATTSFNPYISLLSSSVHHLKILKRPRSRELLWHFVRMGLSSAYQVETRAATPAYISLLNQLDVAMSHHHQNLLKNEKGQWVQKTYLLKNRIQSDKGFEAKRHGALHWSNFHPAQTQAGESTLVPQSIQWQSNFLALAIQFGLWRYLDNSLGTGNKVLTSKKGRPLLNYALSPLPGMEYVNISPNVVRVLLSHGANPNEKFEKKTCWTNALLWQYENFVIRNGREVGSADQAKALAKTRMEILILLVKNRANAKAFCETDNGTMSAVEVVTECFESWDPEGLAVLLQLMAGQEHSVLGKLAFWT